MIFWKRSSQKELAKLVDYLEPALSENGYKYENASIGRHSLGEFASGFFVGDKIKIGLIFRRGKLGSVNYESSETNVSHDQLFDHLKKKDNKKLFYDEEGFRAYTLSNEKLEDALLHDLTTTILPFIHNTPTETLNKIMVDIRNEEWSKLS